MLPAAPARTSPTTCFTRGGVASIGDGANDGEAGEGDDIHGDVERIRGGSGADTLTGDADANMLIGQAGGDTLTGGGGADSLQGGDGADTLQGGDGNDALQGGTGADTLQGDAGSDLADYPRSAPLTVSIGDGANDGETGELDNVAPTSSACAAAAATTR